MRIIVPALGRELRHAFSGVQLLALTSVLLLATTVPALPAQISPAPAGWPTSNSSSGAIYKPDSLQPGKTFVLTIAQPRPLAGQPLTAWFKAQVQADLGQRGAQ